ncbi:MAG: hydrogenase maturation protease [Candidatus Asgardarchaeia archaeon]
MKILVVGVGNPILRDDGVGVHVARYLRRVIGQSKYVDVLDLNTQGLALAEAFFGYDKVIVVDAMMTKNGRPGEIKILKPEDFDSTLHATSPHDTNFRTALEVCRNIDPTRYPKEVVVIGIEVKHTTEFGDNLSPEVAIAVPKTIKKILDIICDWLKTECIFIYDEHELKKVFVEISNIKEVSK